jgi:phenylalanyl-tRNA synthetase beta chain
MPTIDVDLAEFEKMLGASYHGDMEKLDDLLSFVKSEVKLYNSKENIVSIELKDTNRPDLWSVEGLSRTLRSYLKLERGIHHYFSEKPILEVKVDARLKQIRPFIACSVIKNIMLTDTAIRGIMHLQDKLDRTYGRSRQKTSIGLYNFNLIKPPLSYTIAKPDSFKFVPLGCSEEMTLSEIIEQHPKGVEYGYIVKKHNVYPILLDSNLKALSFPPIINSNDLGRITEESKELLIEVTGTNHQTVLNTLNLVTSALIERKGKAYSANIHYPDRSKPEVTPDFACKYVNLSVEYTNKILGLYLTPTAIADLLITAGFGVENLTENIVSVQVPCYRIDVMHQIDLVEDVAIAYGYNNIDPIWRDLPTTGSERSQQRLIDLTREFIIGLGYQEILTYTLTSPENLFTKMNIDKTKTIELSNPKLETMTCLRNRLIPGLLEFLSVNQSVEFPQKIFELGKITLPDSSKETKTRDEEWLAGASCHPLSGFSEIKSCLNSFMINLGVNWQIEPVNNDSFINGRVGAVIVEDLDVGVLGEIHPQVLENWKIENPIAAFEVNLQKIIELKT